MNEELVEELVEELTKAIYQAISKIANAITPLGVSPGRDESGGVVASLTEAVMGFTTGLHKIAEAIDNFSEVYSDVHENDDA